MENIETSLVNDVSFMTHHYWKESDTNVYPVAKESRNIRDSRRCSFIYIRKIRMHCQNIYTVIISKSNLVPLWDSGVDISTIIWEFTHIQGCHFLFLYMFWKWFRREEEMERLSSWLKGGEGLYCSSFSSMHPWPDCSSLVWGDSCLRCHPVTVGLRWI